ncbi:MAG: hypothetical protein R2713_21540 [Ilumatobacteraceae bacterium]
MMGSVTRDELAGVGIQSWVSPVNCAYGAEDPRPEDQERYDSQTYLESFEMRKRRTRVIFDVQERAEAFIAEAQATIDAVEMPTGEPASVLLAYPGMSMMNAAGIPQVFAGPFTDSVIEAAGEVNSFDGLASFNDSALITAEQLAAQTSTCSPSACSCPVRTPSCTHRTSSPSSRSGRSCEEQRLDLDRRIVLPWVRELRRHPEARRRDRRTWLITPCADAPTWSRVGASSRSRRRSSPCCASA